MSMTIQCLCGTMKLHIRATRWSSSIVTVTTARQ